MVKINIYDMEFFKYLEFVQSDLEPIKSFYIKDELNPDFTVAALR